MDRLRAFAAVAAPVTLGEQERDRDNREDAARRLGSHFSVYACAVRSQRPE
jgi:hypothetical protein